MPFSPESGEWDAVQEYIEALPAAAAWFRDLHQEIADLKADVQAWQDKYRDSWRANAPIAWPAAVGQREEMQAEIDGLREQLARVVAASGREAERATRLTHELDQVLKANATLVEDADLREADLATADALLTERTADVRRLADDRDNWQRRFGDAQATISRLVKAQGQPL